MLRSLSPAAALVLCLAFAACGGDDGEGAGGGAATEERAATATEPATEPECRRVPAPKPKGPQRIAEPTLELDPAKTYTATVTTNCGAFTITLDVKRAPKTAASFVYLARRKFFDGLTFHRIVPGFVIQGGDPQGNGTGGPGYKVVEPPPEDPALYRRGAVAMAKAANEAPGTSGSQFFVVTAEDAQLPPEYAYVGKVTRGQDVVDKIGVLPTDADERPQQAVVVESVKVTES